MRTYQLYADAAISANAAANVEIATPGRIKGIQWSIGGNFNGDLQVIQFEISGVPYQQVETNDAQGPILQLLMRSNFVTSGFARFSENGFAPMDYPVANGQRLYVNLVLDGADLAQIVALIHVA